MPPVPALLKKTTTRHEAVIDVADLREALGLPADADLIIVPANDGKGTVSSVKCAWSSATTATEAAKPAPAAKARGAGASPGTAAKASEPAPKAQDSQPAATTATAVAGSDADDDTP